VALPTHAPLTAPTCMHVGRTASGAQVSKLLSDKSQFALELFLESSGAKTLLETAASVASEAAHWLLPLRGVPLLE
jgi:hypothetical protein